MCTEVPVWTKSYAPEKGIRDRALPPSMEAPAFPFGRAGSALRKVPHTP